MKEGVYVPSPLKAKKLTELLIEEIKVLIEADSLKPGDKIPTEQELMRIFKVSRSSVREAISVLRQEGIVDVIQGKGTFLKNNYTPLPDIDDPSFQGLSHFMEARKILESHLARLAAERASEEDLDKMELAVMALENKEAGLSPENVVQADLEFHYALAKSAGNPVLLHLLQEIDSHLQKGRSTTIVFPQGWKRAIEGHKRVLCALRKRSPEEAALQMVKHIEEIEKAQKLITALQKEGTQEKLSYRQ